MRRLLHALYVLFVLFVSLWPRQCVDAYVSRSVQSKDTWIHVACYGGLALVSLWAYGAPARKLRSRVAVWACCVLMGTVLEVLQAAVPGIHRNCNLKDGTDNALGALVGVLLPVGFWPATRKGKGIQDEFRG